MKNDNGFILGYYKYSFLLKLDFERDIFAVMSNSIFKGHHSKRGTDIIITFDSGKVLKDYQIRKIYGVPFKVANFYKLLG